MKLLLYRYFFKYFWCIGVNVYNCMFKMLCASKEHGLKNENLNYTDRISLWCNLV